MWWLWFLCSALFLNEIYTIFKSVILFEIWPKQICDGRTDVRTNSRTDKPNLYPAASGEGLKRMLILLHK